MPKRDDCMPTASEIDAVWGQANFGDLSREHVVKYGLLKCASGWHQGATSRAILTELKLITPKYRLTKRGRRALWEYFCGDSTI